ncbi:zinc finger protein weckle-like [Anopheles bellator]|uniref:zinc finger protein weckle-like n=1 Tax=Anopheles bellator TaxID=139047 RepID=UPI002649835F|nr:zinc finger protein weckle-like [Anopheles bellator]
MLTIHEGGKPFVCEECGTRWSTKSALRGHQVVHSDEYPYHCSYCSKRFKTLRRLQIHEDTHNNTMYVCPHCGLKLNTRRTLQMHMVVHSEERKYKCQHCGKEYKRSKALKTHLILHTGLKPYACPFCDKTFAHGSNCRSHKKKSHPLELAALEAAGGQQPTANIPKLEQLQPKFSELSGSATVTSIPEIVHHVADPTESVVDKTEKPRVIVVDTASLSEDRASNIKVKKDKLTEVYASPIRVKNSNLKTAVDGIAEAT